MRGLVPASTGAVLLLCLGACTVTTERMRFHFDDERRGSFSVAASVQAAKQDADPKDPFGIQKNKLEQSIEEKLKACGLAAVTFKANGREHINARASFSYPDELETSLACIPSGWDVVRVESRRNEGLLRYDYVTTIRLEQPRVSVDLSQPNPSASVAGIDTFPRELSLTVPGTISDVRPETDIIGAVFRVDRYGTEEVRATLAEAPDAKAVLQRLQARAQNALAAGRVNRTNVSRLPRNVYALTVTSYQWKLRLQDILSIAGVLFGSGFLVQFVRSRLPAGRRRRKAEA